MLNTLEQLNRFLEEAAISARINWGVKFYELRPFLVSNLEELKQKISSRGYPMEKLEILLSVLREEEVSDMEILNGLESLEEIFTLSGVQEEKIENFKNLLGIFRNRVNNEEKFRSLRGKLLKNMSPEKSAEYDVKLFKNEGMNYCLVYYVSVYKALSELNTPEEKRKFIEAEEVRLENGGLPGIKQDFKNDESLNKFILLILKDDLRDNLIDVFYNCKETILGDDNPEVIERKLKEYIYELILAFEKQGIKQLSSKFFSPYGVNPTFQNLHPIFHY